MSKPEVSGLAIYPVKSFAQIPLRTARVHRFGLLNDRRWMLVDGNGRFITQRQLARMCLIQPELRGADLLLQAPDMPDLAVSSPRAEIKRRVTVWEDECNGLDCGDDVAEWLERFLSIDCRLVYFPTDEVRAVDPRYAQAGDQTAFSDGFPLLLIAQASLDDLNSRLDSPIAMSRFRPNVVVSGCAAFAEDGWRRIRIGDISYRVVKPCSRCIIPSIDPTSGERGQEPTRTLRDYRTRDNKVFFGQNVIADGEGEIQIGMPVEILE